MFYKITDIKVLDNYQIWLKFNDNSTKTIDCKPFIGKGFTKELLDYDKFKQVKIEDFGGLIWPNGYDICPNFLKEI